MPKRMQVQKERKKVLSDVRQKILPYKELESRQGILQLKPATGNQDLGLGKYTFYKLWSLLTTILMINFSTQSILNRVKLLVNC